MVFFSIPDAETAAACYRDLMLSSNRLNKLMLDILDAGYPAAPGMLVEYHFLLKRVNDLLFEFNVLELEGEQRDFFLKRRPELKGLFDNRARNEVMDRVYLHDEDGGRPDIKDAFLLELTAMRKPYSSLLDDFSGLPLNREQEEWLAFSGQVSIRISRMEFFLRRMAGICGRASVEGLKKHWEWVRNHEKEMVCVARKCEEMFSSLSPEDPLVELFVVIDARLWFHYVDFCEQCMALLSCPGWGNDGDRTLLEEMKAYGSRYTAALRGDVFAADDADTHLEEVKRSGKIVFPRGLMPCRRDFTQR